MAITRNFEFLLIARRLSGFVARLDFTCRAVGLVFLACATLFLAGGCGGGGSDGFDDHDPITVESPKAEVIKVFLEAVLADDDPPGPIQALENEVKEAARSWQGGENCFVSDYTDSDYAANFGLWLRIAREFGFRDEEFDPSDIENTLENGIDLELESVGTTEEIWERVACKLEPDNCVCWSQIYGADVAPDGDEEYDDSMGEPIPPSPELTAECHTPEKLLEFLKETSCNAVSRWEDAPTIRIAEDATDTEKEIVRLVVDRINLAMPWELKIGKDAPARQAQVPDGEIWVEFAPQAEWVYRGADKDDKRYKGIADWSPSGPNSHDIARVHVWVIPYTIKGYYNSEYPSAIRNAYQDTFFVVAHELLHALGLLCHAGRVGGKWFEQSIMGAGEDEVLLLVPRLIFQVEWHGPTVRHEDYFCSADDGFCYYRRQNVPGYIDLDALKALYLHDRGGTPNLGDLPEKLCDY